MNGKQIVGAADFGGGMPLEAETCIVETHPLAVVNHLYQRAAGILHKQLDVFTTRIHGIL